MIEFIDLYSQQIRIKDLINKNISTVLSHGKYINGPEVKTLEYILSSYVNSRFAISCASGTDALTIALMSLNLNYGDEVITTSFSFFATSEVISLLGLNPVFIDIEYDTYNINVSKIESKITNKTKAIIPVSLYGQCSDMDEINKIAEKHNLFVIEDAAQSFGARYKNKKSCNLSLIATTSFFPSKPLGAYGDGGMIFTSNKDIALKLRQIANHGLSSVNKHSNIGLNSRLDSLQAAVLLAKFTIFDDELERRQNIAYRYDKYLKDYVSIPKVKDDRNSVYSCYTIRVENRDDLYNKMKKLAIPVNMYYPYPIYLQKPYRNKKLDSKDFSIVEKLSKNVISIPIHPYLDKFSQDFIIKSIIKFTKMRLY